MLILYILAPILVLSIILLIIFISLYAASKGVGSTPPLPTPVGNLVPTAGPYPDTNKFSTNNSGTGTGVLNSNYCNINLYAKYGYRAERMDSTQTQLIATSNIHWNSFVYTVFQVNSAEAPGFVFKVPTQSFELSEPNIQYKLFVSYYGDDAGTNLLVDSMPVGVSYASNGETMLYESTGPNVNILPSQCNA